MLATSSFELAPQVSFLVRPCISLWCFSLLLLLFRACLVSCLRQAPRPLSIPSWRQPVPCSVASTPASSWVLDPFDDPSGSVSVLVLAGHLPVSHHRGGNGSKTRAVACSGDLRPPSATTRRDFGRPGLSTGYSLFTVLPTIPSVYLSVINPLFRFNHDPRQGPRLLPPFHSLRPTNAHIHARGRLLLRFPARSDTTLLPDKAPHEPLFEYTGCCCCCCLCKARVVQDSGTITFFVA